MVLFGQNGCIWAKVVLFGQKLLFGKKWLHLGKSGSIYICILVALGQNSCNWAKVVVFGQKWFYFGKMVVLWTKVVLFG